MPPVHCGLLPSHCINGHAGPTLIQRSGPRPRAISIHESPNQEFRTGIVLRMLRPCSGLQPILPSAGPKFGFTTKPLASSLRDANSQLRCSFRSSELRNRAKHPSLHRVKPSKLPRLITFPPPIPRLRRQTSAPPLGFRSATADVASLGSNGVALPGGRAL